MRRLRQETRSTREKGGVFQQAMVGKEDKVTQVLTDAVVVAFADEEAAQPLFTHVCFKGHGKAPFPRKGESTGVEIGAEHLDRWPDFVASCLF